MIDILQIFVSESFWAASLRIASPLIFGVLGALVCERAGVLNLGIEGIFVVGAMTGWMTVWLGAPLPVGILAAALAGALFGFLHAVLTVPLGLSQHVSGLGITLFASSLASFAYRTALPQVSSPPRIEPFRPLDIPLLSDIPFFGPVLFQQTALTWLALLLVAVTWWIMDRTPLGLAIKAVGDNPDAVNAQGLSVIRLRMGAVIAGSSLMALGGAFLTMSAFDAFYFGMTNGRGWICVALVIFASWRPGKALIGALLFAGLDAMQVRAQQVAGAVIPYQFFLALPYILSIAAMVVMSRRAAYPKALLTPFRRGDRV